MKLLRRVGIYLIGVVLGSIVVSFFWNKKDVTFDYGMDARTLKTIRIKKRLFTTDATNAMQLHKIDTSVVSAILKNGDVDFGKSKPRIKPCAEYFITGKDSLNHINLYVKRCDSTATVQKVIVNN